MNFLTLIYNLIVSFISEIIFYNIWIVLLPLVSIVFIKFYEYITRGF